MAPARHDVKLILPFVGSCMCNHIYMLRQQIWRIYLLMRKKVCHNRTMEPTGRANLGRRC